MCILLLTCFTLTKETLSLLRIVKVVSYIIQCDCGCTVNITSVRSTIVHTMVGYGNEALQLFEVS